MPTKESPGGIILPDGSSQRSQRGIVVSCGPGKERDDGTYRPINLSPGDIVLFSPYAGDDLARGGIMVEAETADYIILRTEDILATL